LDVGKAVDPTEIIWRNMPVGGGGRFFRQVVTFTFSTLLVVLGIAISVVALFLKLYYSINARCLALGTALLSDADCLRLVSTVRDVACLLTCLFVSVAVTKIGH
jgi:hypothetical protein